ncbi:hypothetical protein DCC39_17280 [Pueribacillus theae]|uniref:Protein kinase domain-containing protein n=1 Tax=Pueribacillus theae TaxID=2171751 RepID=A0A2U1JNW0_9BACI|nr:tetratricopeptide repeat protein [Pueribacillus theae]PWA06685.1 hypothetical protein DCC39_17280 [Pueribacillus theae]
MSFQPEVGDTLRLFNKTYSFSRHPAVEGLEMPYGQEGRQGIVYQLIEETAKEKKQAVALKVFRNRFKNQHQVELSNRIRKYAAVYGLSACSRAVIEEGDHKKLLKKYGDLQYSVMMPWIEGPTWADLVLDEEPLSKEDALQLACTFAYVLKEMEASELAHCDLSSSNVLIPLFEKNKRSTYFADIELVDVEELYAPGLERPEIVPTGSPGYAAAYVKEGIWNKNADRFAGAVLLAEMATWHDESIRKNKADDISYFAEDELQADSERYRLLLNALERTLGQAGEAFFKQVWQSEKPEECPSFSEWFALFPADIKSAVLQRKNGLSGAKNDSIHQLELPVEQLLDIASLFEGIGNKEAAIREYHYIISHYPDKKAIVEEIKLILSEDDRKIDSIELVPEDYLNAAQLFERTGDIDKAVLLYERAMYIPSTQFSVREELKIIVDELRETIRQQKEKETTESKLKKMTAEGERQAENHGSARRPLQPESKTRFSERVKQFIVKRRKMLTLITVAVLLFFLAGWAYTYANEKKWEKTVDLGIEAFKNRDYVTAEQHIREAIAQKSTADLHNKLATIFISRRNYEQAIQYLKTNIENKQIPPSDQEANYLIGRAYFLLNDYSNAVQYYELARKGDKSDYAQDVIRDLVVSYGRLDQFEKANGLVDELEGTDTESSAFIHNLKGELSELQGKESEAVAEYKQAVSLQNENERYIRNLVDAYIQQNKTNQSGDKEKIETYEEAISLMNKLLRKDGANVNHLNRLGQLYYDFGLFYEAEDNPKSKNLFQQALISYNKVIDLGIQNEDVLLNIGIIQNKLDQKEKAEKTYERAIQSYPESGHAHFVFGLFQIQQEKYDKALVLLKKVVKLNQDSSEVSIANERIKEMKVRGLVK